MSLLIIFLWVLGNVTKFVVVSQDTFYLVSGMLVIAFCVESLGWDFSEDEEDKKDG